MMTDTLESAGARLDAICDKIEQAKEAAPDPEAFVASEEDADEVIAATRNLHRVMAKYGKALSQSNEEGAATWMQHQEAAITDAVVNIKSGKVPQQAAGEFLSDALDTTEEEAARIIEERLQAA